MVKSPTRLTPGRMGGGKRSSEGEVGKPALLFLQGLDSRHAHTTEKNQHHTSI